MKSTILILCFMIFAPLTTQAQWWWWHGHKSETKIARMTPAERVDELIEEHFHHRYDVLDEQGDLIEKHILLDGTKALPRLVERINEYDPLRPNGNKETKYWRFEACWFMLSSMDNMAFRLRAAEKGRYAIDALERSVERMRVAGFDAQDNSYNGIFTMVGNTVKNAKGINGKDLSIQDTFRFLYKIKLSDAELLDFSNYLTEHYPEYPSWSKNQMVMDDTEISPAGLPVRNAMLINPERYREAYLEFKKTK